MDTRCITCGSVALSPEHWQQRALEHAERADTLTAGWRARRLSGETHAVEDFLFTYYPVRPALLRRWHPGAGVCLADAGAHERAEWRWYRGCGAGRVVNASAFLTAKLGTVTFVEQLLSQTAARAGQFSCFGLHEWAMVYRQHPGEQRHEHTPLRLSRGDTDAVVESHKIVCSHYDAFRFFTPEAVPLNRAAPVPTRDNQPSTEQPGCLHAGMDVYKWASKLGPLVPGELLLDTFELALSIRTLDMQASPYDVSAYGLPAVAIETDAGKAEYVRQQRSFTERSNALRSRVVEAIAAARAAAGGGVRAA
ncbi:hypothetical protein GCM10022198_16110 [Klugiella xanthotipulae]|uniref:3-methyladenine DNA glycosylase n=1 Tax=Klugiella xanthotipulae TaxID=244735 RepID=A0A543HH77_9MICO|nr:3-methyladenine DNA glycosylase [Klugiella xanthotipulae]TQM57649.1 hypothetical protein FB466_2644 [Klugiella xanthotipulae]